LVGRVEIGAIAGVAKAEFVKFVGGKGGEPTGRDDLRARRRELREVRETGAAAVTERAKGKDLIGLAEGIAGCERVVVGELVIDFEDEIVAVILSRTE